METRRPPRARCSERHVGYLQQPLVVDLAAGNRYLAFRKVNIDLDFAEAYAIQRNDKLSLRYMQEVAELVPDPAIADFLEKQKSFDHLRGTAEFMSILGSFRRFNNFWDSSALDTAFREDLSESEKLAGLGKFWSEVKYNFAFPDRLVALEWDKCYLDSIPKVIATKSTEEYYAELMRLCAQLQDGHTNVYPPEQLDTSAKPPMRTGLVQNRVVILEVTSASLEQTGIRPGMEILSVDGVPAIEEGRRYIEPYQSSSTPQDLDLGTFGYGFLRGPSKKPVRLVLRTADGHDFEREIPRSGYKDIRPRPLFSWRMLKQNIAYVALNSFENKQPAKEWAKAFPETSRADGIILDLRLNGGGSSSVGYEILS